MGALLLLVLQAVSGDAGVPQVAAGQLVHGTVTGPDQQPLSGVVMFAVDSRSNVIARMVTSDEHGRVQMRLAPRPHRFGVLSARYGIERLVSKGPSDFVLTLRPLPPPTGAAPASDAEAPVIRARGALLIQGRVLDEGGRALPGVRVDAARATEWQRHHGKMWASGVVVSSAFTGTDGAFTMAIPGGDTQLQARAPGLLLRRSANLLENGRARADRPVLIMGVDAAIQQVTVSEGRVLRVRLEDSIDPEYSPPAPLRAWLQFAYGICPIAAPLTAHRKRMLKKYWYLDVLRNEPPNPATVSATACTPPAAYGGVPLGVRGGSASLPDFEVHAEALPAP